MIASIFHSGSGLGNQLHRYVIARVTAIDKGYEFGMIYPENFKGSSFMSLDMGVPVKELLYEFNEEKVVNKDGHDVRPYDYRVGDVEDFTLIDGEFQGETYYEHRLDEVRDWLKTEPLELPEDVCIINFRGGEYVGVRDLFLPQEYWDKAVEKMRTINPNMRFIVVTDDVDTAGQFFPDFMVRHNLSEDWRSIRYAKYLILSNSSFAILPALLGNTKKIIAPKYWAGYNKGYWQLPQNNYKKFTYI